MNTPLQSDPRLHDAIRNAAANAAVKLVGDRVVARVTFEPGDGTKYDVILFEDEDRRLWCAVPNFCASAGNGLWHYGDWAHAEYVREKQHIRGSSAAVVADLINLVGGFEVGGEARKAG